MTDERLATRDRLIRLAIDPTGTRGRQIETRRNAEDGEPETLIRGMAETSVRIALECYGLRGWIVETVETEDGPAVLAY